MSPVAEALYICHRPIIRNGCNCKHSNLTSSVCPKGIYNIMLYAFCAQNTTGSFKETDQQQQ